MKTILIIVGASALVFAIVQVFAMSSRSRIEKYPYTLVKRYDKFEIRQYESCLFTSVKIPTDRYEDASGTGFRMLANYIFGGNSDGQKIAMTSPVTMTLEDSMTMMFMVPRNLNKEELPTPNDPNIAFREEPRKTVAAIRFSGWANSERIEKFKASLITELELKGIDYTNNFYYLGYNPPYDAVNRRNEVIVELAKD